MPFEWLFERLLNGFLNGFCMIFEWLLKWLLEVLDGFLNGFGMVFEWLWEWPLEWLLAEKWPFRGGNGNRVRTGARSGRRVPECMFQIDITGKQSGLCLSGIRKTNKKQKKDRQTQTRLFSPCCGKTF